MRSVEHRHVAVRVVVYRLNDSHIASLMMIMSIGVAVDNPVESRPCKAGTIVFSRNVMYKIDSAGFDGFSNKLRATPKAVGLRMRIQKVNGSLLVPHRPLPTT